MKKYYSSYNLKRSEERLDYLVLAWREAREKKLPGVSLESLLLSNLLNIVKKNLIGCGDWI